MSVTTTVQATRPSVRTGLVGVLAAVVAAVAVWAVAKVAGAELRVAFGDAAPMDVTVVNVVAAALAGSLVGWGALLLLSRFTAKARTVWTVAAAIAVLLSLGGPLSATGSAGTKASLAAMHLAVAVVLITTLRRATRP